MSMSATYVSGAHNAAQKTVEHKILLAFSNNYASPGETLDLTAMTQIAIAAKEQIRKVSFQSQKGHAAALVYIPGTNLTDGKVGLWTPAGTEFSNGAYTSGLTGDTVHMFIEVFKA